MAVGQADIELDPRIDVAAAQAAPALACKRYRAERGGRIAAFRGHDDRERTERGHAG